VITPVLRGLGADEENLSSAVTLGQHIEDVSRALDGVAGQAILVGHSYAGMVVRGAVEGKPSKVEGLVFLDAFLPEDGQCAIDLLPGGNCELLPPDGARAR
jgi:pimeloyl-ACP methyl ester carboxylesterase